jgi:hypothetical protein
MSTTTRIRTRLSTGIGRTEKTFLKAGPNLASDTIILLNDHIGYDVYI